MNTIAVVFSAEFERRLRSRIYIAGTLLGAIAIALIAFLPVAVTGFAVSTKNVVLVGDPELTAAAENALRGDYAIVAREPQLDAPPTIAYLDAHSKAAAVAVLERRGSLLHVTAYTRDPGSLRPSFARDLAALQLQFATGIPQVKVTSLSRVAVEERDIGGKFADADHAEGAKFIGLVFVMVLYLSILLNAQSIVMAVAEEKTSRIAELLISAIDPSRLLFAKVLAATATGFIQLGIWIVTAAVAAQSVGMLFSNALSAAPASAGAASAATLTAPSVPEVLWFIVFFVIGFAQCAVLFAAAGSLVSRSEDVGSVTGPLYIPIIGAIFIAQFALQFPNATNVVTFSFIPLFAPFVMFTRVIVSTVPAWQLALSLAINIGAAVALAWFAGRIYRVGLLMYGKLPTPRQFVAAMRQR